MSLLGTLVSSNGVTSSFPVEGIDGNGSSNDAGTGNDMNRPLAVRMRPRTLDEVIGQGKALSNNSPLRMVAAPVDSGVTVPPAVILTGPPGVGKTSIAKILARQSQRKLVELSATSSSVKDVKAVIEQAKSERMTVGDETLLFIDEIHRFTKSQQDALLPAVENHDVMFVAATTENPSYAVIRPLLSRSMVVRLEPLDRDALGAIIDHAIVSPLGLDDGVVLDEDAREAIMDAGGQDARKTLGVLEMVASSVMGKAVDAAVPCRVTADDVRSCLEVLSDTVYDRTGDDHYDMVSAFIKSMRGSDAQAAVYWAARMLDAGEDPMFIARRVVIAAAEEVGLANPQALVLATSAANAVNMVGMPEARIILSEAILAVATSPKSNASYQAMNRALEYIHEGHTGPVPLHLRNASDSGKRDNGYGAGYKYPHDYPDALVQQQYMPDGETGAVFYEPKDSGRERDIMRKMDHVDEVLHG